MFSSHTFANLPLPSHVSRNFPDVRTSKRVIKILPGRGSAHFPPTKDAKDGSNSQSPLERSSCFTHNEGTPPPLSSISRLSLCDLFHYSEFLTFTPTAWSPFDICDPVQYCDTVPFSSSLHRLWQNPLSWPWIHSLYLSTYPSFRYCADTWGRLGGPGARVSCTLLTLKFKWEGNKG